MIAQIGTQVVLASELMWPINQRLAEYEGQLSPEMIQEVRKQAADNMKVQLAGLLDFKLLVNEVYAQLPPEGIENVEKQLSEPFEDEALPELMKQFSARSRGELDARLRKYGSSLSQLRRGYFEGRLARMWISEQTGDVAPVTRDELQQEYEENLDDYAYPAKARWQELMVRFDRVGGDRQAAYHALVAMGNLVKMHEAGRGGAPFEAVAKERSHGLTASSGGMHDWTAQGSLVAEEIDSALFTLPVGRLSKIIPSTDGYHIVRVVERRRAGHTPFEEAQAAIREKLLAARRREKQREYIEKLRREVRIWTIYTGPTTAAEYIEFVRSATSAEPDQ